jgi:glycosyltransferase involved in cell wall biosynthesis
MIEIMRILHLCLSNFYVDGYSYQENELVRQNVADGHDVRVIASTEVIGADGKLSYLAPGSYMGQDNAPVERVAYSGWLPEPVMRKLRFHRGIYRRIEAFRPDVILFHSACGGEITTAARYARTNHAVALYVDSHEDFVNSARGPISRWFLHWLFYRPVLRLSLRYVRKVLPVSLSCLEFMRDFYGVPEEKLEFFPLGGRVIDDEEYASLRRSTRAKLGLSPDQVLIVQSGKLDRSKKLIEALEAFSEQSDPKLKFAIAGHIHPSIEPEVRSAVSGDPRIRELGWQSAEDLRALLCAADVYCQPGTQSATMQMAVCCRCPIILDNVRSHEPYLDDNGWLVSGKDELRAAFRDLPHNLARLPAMAARSHQLALRMLDYRLLAARIYR